MSYIKETYNAIQNFYSAKNTKKNRKMGKKVWKERQNPNENNYVNSCLTQLNRNLPFHSHWISKPKVWQHMVKMTSIRGNAYALCSNHFHRKILYGLGKVNICTPYDTEVPPLVLYPKEDSQHTCQELYYSTVLNDVYIIENNLNVHLKKNGYEC